MDAIGLDMRVYNNEIQKNVGIISICTLRCLTRFVKKLWTECGLFHHERMWNSYIHKKERVLCNIKLCFNNVNPKLTRLT